MASKTGRETEEEDDQQICVHVGLASVSPHPWPQYIYIHNLHTFNTIQFISSIWVLHKYMLTNF